MGLNVSTTSYISQTTISSTAANSNQAAIVGAENPSFTSVLQTAGTQETGIAGGLQITPNSGVNIGFAVNFKRTMSNTPTSITLTTIATSQAQNITANQIHTTGFLLFWQGTVAGGQTEYLASYQTNGN